MHKRSNDEIIALLKSTDSILQYGVVKTKEEFSFYLGKIKNHQDKKRHRRENLTAEQLQKKHAADQAVNMSEDRLQKKHAANQTVNMTEDRIQKKHASDQTVNMTDDRIQKKHAANQAVNMSEDRLQKKHASDQAVNMTENRLLGRRSQQKSRVRFKSLEQEWDFENTCPHCHALYLKSETNSERKYCCQNGAYLERNSCFPHFNELPSVIFKYLLDHDHYALHSVDAQCEVDVNDNGSEESDDEATENALNSLGILSNVYNNILSLGNNMWS